MRVALFLILLLLNLLLAASSVSFILTEFRLNQSLDKGFDKVEYILANSEFDFLTLDDSILLSFKNRGISLGSNFAITEETADLRGSLTIDNIVNSGCRETQIIFDKNVEFESQKFQNSLIFFDYCLKT